MEVLKHCAASATAQLFPAPLVTVVIPAFNPGNYLRLAVQSILCQTFKDFELIVIDDGSTDGSFEQLANERDFRLRLVHNERNLGLVKTRNLGIDLARAPLLAVLDSDDIAKPNRLQLQVERFISDPDLVLLGSCADVIDSTGQVCGSIDTREYLDADIRKSMLRVNWFIQSSVMFRTEVVRNLGGYPANIPIAEDYALWLKIIAAHKVGNLRERLVQYRVHGAQISQRKIRMVREMAHKIQQETWDELVVSGRSAGFDPPEVADVWSRLRAGPGTLGRDYLGWAERYRQMGDRKAAFVTALAGLKVSPLSWALVEVSLPYRARPSRLWEKVASR